MHLRNQQKRSVITSKIDVTLIGFVCDDPVVIGASFQWKSMMTNYFERSAKYINYFYNSHQNKIRSNEKSYECMIFQKEQNE